MKTDMSKRIIYSKEFDSGNPIARDMGGKMDALLLRL